MTNQRAAIACIPLLLILKIVNNPKVVVFNMGILGRNINYLDKFITFLLLSLSYKFINLGVGENNLMIKNKLNIGTLGSEIKDKKFYSNENVVKVTTKHKLDDKNVSEALSFKRNYIPKKLENVYHHIGIYAYKIEALEKFVNLNQTENEIKNRLEQLRALENDIKINITLTNYSPIGVDTKEDYLALKKIMEYKS